MTSGHVNSIDSHGMNVGLVLDKSLNILANDHDDQCMFFNTYTFAM